MIEPSLYQNQVNHCMREFSFQRIGNLHKIMAFILCITLKFHS